ncbi:hypothetical protein SAMN05446037_1001170 [Anaerovirgula multivorans]|uniref:Lipoprotein n=1 Tax=Anaerovirgula multivorans TaxID=312168 RepID=A0A238ZX35_9FIRM|nr:hypothetical protein [Anaerovirgula multivorans]SNR87561.1 hypothetical protein SAMN05446037_1001170 [Anaerovirgula multivorans]
MKKYKKIVSSVVLIFMILTFTTACSSPEEELSFEGLIEEMEQLEKYETQGEISINIKELPQSFLENLDDESQLVLNAIENYSFIYEFKEDTNTRQAALTLFVNDKINNEKIPFLSILSNEDTYYVKIDDIKNFIEKFVDTNSLPQEINTAFALIFGDTEYISFTVEEILDLYIDVLELSGEMDEGEIDFLKQVISNASFDQEFLQQEQNEMIERFEPFVEKAMDIYSNLKMDLVNQENNKFTISISIIDFLDLVQDFTNYSIDNANEVGELLKEFLPVYIETVKEQMYDNNMMGMYFDETEIESLTVEFDTMLEEISNQIDYFVEEVSSNKEHYKSMVDASMDTLRSEVQNYAENTKLNIIFEKIDSHTYETIINLNIDINTGVEKIAFDFFMERTIKALDSFEITMPTDNVMEGRTFFNRVENIIETMQ